MLSNFLQQRLDRGDRANDAGPDCAGDAGVVIGCSAKMPFPGAKVLTRRHSKNIGGRIAPAAIAGLIEGPLCSVNAFRALSGQTMVRRNEVKVLTRLNFSRPPFKPGRA